VRVMRRMRSILLHRVHRHISAYTSQHSETRQSNRGTYKNVPAEKSRSTPVRHRVELSSPLEPDPRVFTMMKVSRAPTGAAKLKTSKWALAARLDRPCLSRTDVKPKEAGALWTRSARKMTKLRLALDPDAPRAMPSAAAWITSPVVVAKL
jgi:hypothetical protein